jgi:hypothetical protein
MRAKLVGLGLLLCLALGLTIFCGVRIVQGVQGFQQTRQQANSGDVRTIRPWMTLRYVSHVYHTPESYLLQSLHISDATSARHVTLAALATRLHMPESALIQQTRQAILTYRTQHPTPSPSATPHSAIPPPEERTARA